MAKGSGESEQDSRLRRGTRCARRRGAAARCLAVLGAHPAPRQAGPDTRSIRAAAGPVRARAQSSMPPPPRPRVVPLRSSFKSGGAAL
eukprot:3137201-Pyramimonas_sp.AAC.1